MTEGAPWKRLLEFSIPMLIGNFAQQLYNTVDSIVVGEYIGDLALSAVGSAAPILNLLLALFVGVSTGAGIVVSQYYGAGAREKLSRAVGNCITLGFIATVATMVIGVLIARPMLTLLDTPVTIYEWCADYLTLYFLGAIGFTFYNILSGILRGLGDSVSALLFLLVSAGLNIVLDIWFVAGLKMGVPGVALATVLAQGISAVLCLLKLMRMRSVFDLTFSMLSLRKDVALRIVKLGLPSGITQAIISVAMLTVQALTNSMGEMVIAVAVVIMRVDGFAMLPNMSFGQAMTVYTGQNVGARRLDRVHEGTKQGLIMNVAISAAITVLVTLAMGGSSGAQLLAIVTAYLIYNGIIEQFILYPMVIGESLGLHHNLADAIAICRAMDEEWSKGAEIMKQLLPEYLENPDRADDIGVALAWLHKGLVHRLDRPVGGLVVLARTSKAADRLSEQVRKKTLARQYVAAVRGEAKETAELNDWLLKDEKTNTKTALVDALREL